MRLFILAAPLVLPLVLAAQAPALAEGDTVHVSSRIKYDARPDQGPVLVSWDISFQNNDPATSGPEDTGTVVFYENVTVPVLRGVTAISAVSSAGTALDVALEETGSGPTMAARISFDTRVFYGETYDLHLAYQLAEVRVPSLLVTPTYVYLPLIAGGDESTVTVNHPTTADWSVSLEPGECTPSGTTFTCSGDDAGFLAGLLEVSRPDAVAKLPFEVALNEETVSVTLSYFLGERDAAEHLRELTIAGLPIIEDHYGFPYPGTNEVAISHGGRQSVLGYEGLTTCRPNSECEVVVSPAADDVTFLHELAHLWSSIYGERWLSEGFAQMIAEEMAALPEGLVQSRPPEREPLTTELRLDDWGSVSSLLGAKDSEREVESAGYDRSLQFLYELRLQAGTEALRLANAQIAVGEAADSKRFMDVIEETSGKSVDALFAEWVFPDSLRPSLDKRRQARDRLQEVTRKLADVGLSAEAPDSIRNLIEAWQFDTALTALNEFDRNFAEYEVLMQALDSLKQKAENAGLTMPPQIAKQTQAWEFNAARLTFAEASRALDAYVMARERIDAHRGIWERFGLLGKDPDQYLRHAADDFAAGDFEEANDDAVRAREMIDDAPGVAFRRLVMLAAVFGLIAGGAALGGWFTRRRENEEY
jgi:hypothetical protein